MLGGVPLWMRVLEITPQYHIYGADLSWQPSKKECLPAKETDGVNSYDSACFGGLLNWPEQLGH